MARKRTLYLLLELEPTRQYVTNRRKMETLIRYGSPTSPKLQAFDRESAFWAFDFVANWMGLNYRNMSLEVVYPKKAELQRWVLEKAAQAEVRAAKPGGDGPADVLGQAQTDIQEHVAVTWWALADTLVTRYALKRTFLKCNERLSQVQ